MGKAMLSCAAPFVRRMKVGGVQLKDGMVSLCTAVTKEPRPNRGSGLVLYLQYFLQLSKDAVQYHSTQQRDVGLWYLEAFLLFQRGQECASVGHGIRGWWGAASHVGAGGLRSFQLGSYECLLPVFCCVPGRKLLGRSTHLCGRETLGKPWAC